MGIRSTIAFLLVLLYGIALMKPALPLLDYYIKMDAYLEQCSNRNRPELQCNGQCILMQKLKALNGTSQSPAPPVPAKINLQEYPIGFIEIPRLDTPRATERELNWKPFGHTSAIEYMAEIFHPPANRI